MRGGIIESLVRGGVPVTVAISNARLYERQFRYSEKMEDVRGDTVE